MPTTARSPELDFCIVGAIKAGTSSLFAWLSQQDGIAASAIKEPYYWCAPDAELTYCGPGDEYWLRGGVTDSQKYNTLFPCVQGLRGEASAGYLHDPIALQRICGASAKCKIIILLREPVARMHAAYRHAVRDGFEPAMSFEAALEAEQSRVEADWGPLYHYRRVSCYSAQLTQCYELFGRDRILVLFFEDLVSRPAEVLERVSQFLDIKPSHWLLPRENVGMVPRRARLRKKLLAAVHYARPVARSLKLGSKKQWGAKALSVIDSITLWKPAINETRRSQLSEEFQWDIEKVQSMLGESLPQSWQRR